MTPPKQKPKKEKRGLSEEKIFERTYRKIEFDFTYEQWQMLYYDLEEMALGGMLDTFRSELKKKLKQLNVIE